MIEHDNNIMQALVSFLKPTFEDVLEGEDLTHIGIAVNKMAESIYRIHVTFPEQKHRVLDTMIDALNVLSSELLEMFPGQFRYVYPMIAPDGSWLFYCSAGYDIRERININASGADQLAKEVEEDKDFKIRKDVTHVVYDIIITQLGASIHAAAIKGERCLKMKFQQSYNATECYLNLAAVKRNTRMFLTRSPAITGKVFDVAYINADISTDYSEQPNLFQEVRPMCAMRGNTSEGLILFAIEILIYW